MVHAKNWFAGSTAHVRPSSDLLLVLATKLQGVFQGFLVLMLGPEVGSSRGIARE